MAEGKGAPKVTVIVLCWNNRDLLEGFFQSVYDQTYKNWQIIMVDNGSADDSVKYTKKNHPKVRLIETGKNLGFAIGNNVGIKAALEDPEVQYVLLLNTDATLREDWMEKMVAFAVAHPAAAGLQSITLDYYDHKVTDSCGILIDDHALATQIGYRQKHLAPKTMRVFGVNAAACLYSRAFLEAQPFGADYLDSDLWMYLEDVDLAARATMMGWENWLVAETEAYHMGSASSAKLPGAFSMFRTYRNNWPVLLKNLPARIIWRAWPGLVRADLARMRAFLREGQFTLLKAVVKGRLISIGLTPVFLKKRRELQRHWKISEEHLWKLMTIPKIPRRKASDDPFGTERVAMVVVSANQKAMLADTLEALEAQTYENRKVFVVDNAARDGTGAMLEERYPEAEVLKQKSNLGAANGFNVGMNRASIDAYDYVALVKPGFLPEPAWLEEAVRVLRSQPKAMAVATNICDADGNTVHAGYEWRPGRLPEGLTEAGSKPRQVLGFSDAASLVNLEMLETAGWFDGEFFDGLEDLDLSLRARARSGEIWLAPKAKAVAPDVMESRRMAWFHDHKNTYYLYLKNLPFKLFMKYLPAAISLTAVDLVRSIGIGYSRQELKAIAKSVVKTPLMLRARARNNRKRVERSVVLGKWLGGA
jgi:GT2 family glycosyltransferase